MFLLRGISENLNFATVIAITFIAAARENEIGKGLTLLYQK